jgi:hypothetical protein
MAEEKFQTMESAFAVAGVLFQQLKEKSIYLLLLVFLLICSLTAGFFGRYLSYPGTSCF